MPRELKEEEIKGLPEITVALTVASQNPAKDYHQYIEKVLKQRGVEFEHIQYDALEEKDKVIVWKDYDTPVCIAKVIKAR